MFLARKLPFYLPEICKTLRPINAQYITKQERRFGISRSLFEDTSKTKEEVGGSVESKYEIFVDENSPIIFDIEEERRKFYEINDETDQKKEKEVLTGIDPSVGKTGVIDLEELIGILRKEKAMDMVVIEVPPSLSYVNHMVIVTGKSARHIQAIATFVRKVYKYKLGSNYKIPDLEGQQSKNWKAVDLGNIVLHIFSEITREHFDLETLWSVDKEYDNILTSGISSPAPISADLPSFLNSSR